MIVSNQISKKVSESCSSRSVLFCGLGSIGQKHLRNLVHICQESNVKLTIDALRHSHAPLSDDIASHIRHIHTSYEEVSGHYDFVMITNPTHLHHEAMIGLQAHTNAMFVEKPVFDRIQDLSGIDTSVVFYVACPLRHTSILRYVKENIRLEDVFHVRAICSSYLPGWRPLVDYTKVYSANKDMGGGVELDLIHEWDYLTDLFGFPEQIARFGGTHSQLNISSHDIAIYVGQQTKRLLELHLDYFGHLPRRELELYLPDNTLIIDINASTIKDKSGTILTIDKEDMYVNEMRYFIDLVDGKKENINNIWHAQQILGIAIK